MSLQSRKAIPVFLSFILAACGGGSDSPATSNTAKGSGSQSTTTSGTDNTPISTANNSIGSAPNPSAGSSGSTASGTPSESPITTFRVDESARFDTPYDFGSDASGNLFVRDIGNHAIRKIASDGSVSTILTGLSGILAATFDSQGNIYLLSSNSIVKVTPNGGKSTIVSGFAELVLGQASMTVDADGNIYIHGHEADAMGNPDVGTIWKVAPSGSVAKTPVEGGLNSGSAGIARDSAGNLYVGNGGGPLLKITPSGTVKTIATAPLHSIGVNDVKVDNAGNVYFSAYEIDVSSSSLCYDHGICGPFIRHTVIMKVSTDGTVSTLLGEPPGEDEYAKYRFGSAHIAVTPNGKLYVAYATNHAIYRIENDVAVLAAGKPGEAGATD